MTDAKQVPALIAAHQEYLTSPGYIEYASRFLRSMEQSYRVVSKTPYTNRQMAEAGWSWCQTESNFLNISKLYHVSESMTAVAMLAATKLPAETHWEQQVFPSINGALIFEKTLHFRDAWDQLMSLEMITWHKQHDGTWAFALYSSTLDTQDHYNIILRSEGKDLGHLGRWAISHLDARSGTLQEWIQGDEPEIQKYREGRTDTIKERAQQMALSLDAVPMEIPSFSNIYHLIYSLFSLMDQSIVTLSEETDRRLARRNRDKKRPPPMVTVVKLRRREAHGYHEEGTGRWLTYCSWTDGHWRMQHYGPGRSQVKRIWINSYLRGDPETMPFHQPKRVSTLVR